MLTLPPPLSPALAHARDAYRSGQFDAAATEYNAIISAGGPDMAGAYAGLARADLKLKKPADAFTAAQKAVSLDEHLATAHTALGEVYYRLGRMGEAEHELQTPLKEKIADPRGFYGLYRISLATSNYKNAKTSAGTEVSGTLGFGMLFLLDIKIDYRDGLVDFSYDEHRFH